MCDSFRRWNVDWNFYNLAALNISQVAEEGLLILRISA